MLGGSTDYPVISSGSIYTTLDPFGATSASGALVNNGAYNVPGTRYQLPFNPANAIGAQPYKGISLPLTVAYVLYGSATNPNFLANPGVVYWTDESYTTVSGHSADSFLGVDGVAGYVLLNTTQYPGSYTGATLATLVNNSYSKTPTPYSGGSYLFIAVGGFLPGATAVASSVAGDWLIGGSGTDFTPVRVAKGTAPTNKVLGQAQTAVTVGGLCDVWLGPYGIQ